MLADFYIPRLSNDIYEDRRTEKLFAGVKFCTEVWTLLKTDLIVKMDPLSNFFNFYF